MTTAVKYPTTPDKTYMLLFSFTRPYYFYTDLKMTTTAINQYFCNNCHVPVANCICHKITPLTSLYDFILLTHPRELQKGTNSGFLLARMLNARTIIWHRKQTKEASLDLEQDSTRLLVYPTKPDDNIRVYCNLEQAHKTDSKQRPTLILLDGTWQECTKMLNQTPWLQQLPRLHLDCDKPSNFSLRRNLRPGTVSTCETAAQLLKLTEPENSTLLNVAFDAFIQAYSKGKNNQLTTI